MAKIYKLAEVKARQIMLAKLKEMLGELFHLVVIPPTNMTDKKQDYILPRSIMRRIDELSFNELNDLIEGHLKFFILK